MRIDGNRKGKTGGFKKPPAALREVIYRGCGIITTKDESITTISRNEPLAFCSLLGTDVHRSNPYTLQFHKTAKLPPPCLCKGRTPNPPAKRFSSSPPYATHRGPSPWPPRGCHSSLAFSVLLMTSSSVPASLNHDAPCNMSTLTGGKFSFVPFPIRFDTTFAPHGIVRSSRITPL